MARKAKHSPAPWHIDAGHHGISIRAGRIDAPFGGDLVASVFDTADADHIVRCVNAHDEIAAFLWELASGRNATTRDLPKSIIRDARALLAKLEGGK